MERAAVVGLDVGRDGDGGPASLEELKRLLETAGAVAVAEFVQKRPRRDPATLVGRGKAGEIGEEARRRDLDLVALDEDLTPAQQRNLQEIIPAKVVDRTRLILDIFAQRARTREGKLQVELAQLSYLLPRITEKFGRFEQQTGGIGTRGPGERKLEVDRRRIEERIVRIRREIGRVQAQRGLRRENRRRVPLPVATLIGYTNAGKSTLLNALTRAGGAGVYADDKLFATLDPTTRRVKLPGGRTALFTDTVGFIQKLPHHLVAAFHATLEEAASSDLLVHVLDASDPRWPAQEAVAKDVLKEVGAENVPVIRAFNKADAVPSSRRSALRRAGGVLLSARTGEGLDDFLKAAETRLEKDLMEKEILLPHGRGDLLSALYGSAHVLSEESSAGGVRLRLRIDRQNWGRLEKSLKGTRPAARNGHDD
ncbi:MAG: GTPase HflX [Elusimicrobiota bacterium]